MHKRGINVRYLGTIYSLAAAEGNKLVSIKTLSIQEMISRACKHILNAMLRGLPGPLVSFCISHFLNCLLGAEYNPDPKVIPDEGLWKLYHDADFGFEKLTIDSLRDKIEREVQRRYRFTLEEGWIGGIKHLQMLREVALKMGLQLRIKNYTFGPVLEGATANEESPAINGHPKVKSNGKKKSPAGSIHELPTSKVPTTFDPEDVMNIVAIVKDSSSKVGYCDILIDGLRLY
jgi:protein TIF31